MDKACEVDGCQRPYFCKGWCRHHYNRNARNGHPTAVVPGERSAYTNAIKMAWLRDAAAPDTDECLIWPWTRSTTGYGMVSPGGGGRLRYAMHVALEMAGHLRPPAPANRALHSCDQPLCCNVRHLRWGTQRENVADAVARSSLNQGERNGRSRLTEEQVTAMRTAWVRGGVLQREHCCASP